jgi:putative ABC transport system permease protein
VPLNYPDASIVIRTPLDVATLVSAVKGAIFDAGSEEPIYNVQTMQEIISDSMSAQRFPMILLSAFAGLALLLAAVGIYGMISYSITQRVREIAIRMALGANQKNVLRLFVGQQLKLVLWGIAIGSATALIITKTVASFSHLLYGVTSSDPITFVAVPLLMITLAALASYLPARRAAQVDPMVAFRSE